MLISISLLCIYLAAAREGTIEGICSMVAALCVFVADMLSHFRNFDVAEAIAGLIQGTRQHLASVFRKKVHFHSFGIFDLELVAFLAEPFDEGSHKEA